MPASVAGGGAVSIGGVTVSDGVPGVPGATGVEVAVAAGAVAAGLAAGSGAVCWLAVFFAGGQCQGSEAGNEDRITHEDLPR